VEYPNVTEPAGAAEPSSAVTQPIPPIAGERCAQCSAPLARDQRYCLQCGEPRAHLAAPPSAIKSPGETPSSPPRTPPGVTPASSPTPARNNSLALLAGIGVLLLAMGVGVLIGRAGAGTAKAPPAQVISLGAAAGAGAGAASTPTATAPATETPAAAKAKEAKAAESKAKEAKGAGNSISKPAPPTVLKSVNSHESRQSFEQKSKNLPNVVSTG
jgi:hypothetical protein